MAGNRDRSIDIARDRAYLLTDDGPSDSVCSFLTISKSICSA